ncbi:MAG: trimethylamine methyltransferase, partial [Gammaproteobacteria bacterium]|nr:trimethylamine methyltransferase [Gammaproteobacteria bacterium]
SVGATISGQNVRIGRGTLLELVARAPAEFDLHARNAARTVRIGGSNSVISPGYGAPFVLDFDGKRRPSKFSDLRDFYKLTHMASAIQINGGVIVEPQDIPVNLRHLHTVQAIFEDTDKPALGPVTSKQAAYDGIEMAKLVFGEAFVENNPVMIGLITSNSPRKWSETMLESLKLYARNNQALLVCPFTMIGAAMPCNAAATMALAIAEACMAIALTQIIRPGAPVVMGLVGSSVSMRSGAPAFSSPVAQNFTFLAGQMARRYNLSR